MGGGLGKRRGRGGRGKWSGGEGKGGPKLLLNQGLSEPCYATGSRNARRGGAVEGAMLADGGSTVDY